jgi:ribosomal protein S18 acetylase RimI-like enzyme
LSLTIRLARTDEIAACAALYERVARETFTWFPAEVIQAATFVEDARHEEVRVALLDGRIVGLASLYRPDQFLHSLYIDAAARGRGVGLALLNAAREAAGGPLSLKVQKLNARAIAFYRREGFEIIDEGEPEAPGGGWFRMSELGN